MNTGDVLAVIVSYNGVHTMRRTVESLHGQVGHIHVVDNGSAPPTLALLAALEEQALVTADRLGVNRGIGYALNRGAHYARAHGFAWLLTMDQDSVAGVGMLDAYRAALVADDQLVCLAPTMDKNGAPTEVAGIAAYAITSGNLVRVDLFDQIGPYDEGLFIDCVDFDFSLRVRRAGHLIFRAANARLTHQVGDAVNLPRWARRYYTQHSPRRRYYMYRNYGYMVKRYLTAFPAFTLKLTISQLILTALISVLDSAPAASYRAIGRGLRDFAMHRTGRDPEDAS